MIDAYLWSIYLSIFDLFLISLQLIMNSIVEFQTICAHERFFGPCPKKPIGLRSSEKKQTIKHKICCQMLYEEEILGLNLILSISK